MPTADALVACRRAHFCPRRTIRRMRDVRPVHGGAPSDSELSGAWQPIEDAGACGQLIRVPPQAPTALVLLALQRLHPRLWASAVPVQDRRASVVEHAIRVQLGAKVEEGQALVGNTCGREAPALVGGHRSTPWAERGAGPRGRAKLLPS
eukprot:CAMPEP_0119431412 /NCGR_PEP_ID=MMETSP1335-20130426/45867_1 /TAXON_ID=259385 /ORGANISM="Chrysoculter rhomboideus, Strain RCC1486" /LENGTH=149 /DNA_ID=CAMNT_0007457205 /DNA_START=72 /DNA_END=518 /DNA_ORIENTATION=+